MRPNAVRQVRIAKAVKAWSSLSARRQGWALDALQDEADRQVPQLERMSEVARKMLAKEIGPTHKAYNDVLAMSLWSTTCANELNACKSELVWTATGRAPQRLVGTKHTKNAINMLRAFAGNWGPEDIGEAIDELDSEHAKRLKRYPNSGDIDDYASRRASLVTQHRSAKIRVKPIRAACDVLAALYKPAKVATKQEVE